MSRQVQNSVRLGSSEVEQARRTASEIPSGAFLITGSNKCRASSNKCLTSSNKKLLELNLNLN